MILTVICTVILIIIAIVYYWFKQKLNYWSKRNIVTTTLLPFDIRLKLKTNFGLYLQKIYNEIKDGKEKIVGIYIGLQPAVMIKDTNLIEELLMNDLEYNSQKRSDHDILSTMTMFRFNTQKDKHKKVLGIFNEQNLKDMYPLMEKVAKDLEYFLFSKGNKNFVQDVNNMVSLYTCDITANIVFGTSSNCLKIPDIELYHKQVLTILEYSWLRFWKFCMVNFSNSNYYKESNYVKMFDADVEYIMRIATDYVMCERERRKFKRNDMVEQLVKLKLEAKANDEYTEKEHDILLALAFGLYASLFDASFTLSYALYELAKNAKSQMRLREEIRQALKESDDGSVSLEKLNSLEYLDMVICEILRLYPLYPFIYRKYTETSYESLNKHLQSEFNYKASTDLPIVIPIYAFHHDSKFWPNPSQFDPERFSSANKSNIHPMSYLPFGNNPYDCFGSHFIALSIKLGLFYLLKNHSVRACSQTSKKLKFDPHSPTLRLKDNIYLEFVNDKLYNKEN